jgi:hypothetical protein
MAESTLSIDYDDIKLEVATFMAWGRNINTLNATQESDFSQVLKRGLLQFYFPPTGSENPYYEWSFLKKTGTITLVDGTANYDMPDDFGGTILDRSVAYDAQTGWRAPQKVNEHLITRTKATGYKTGIPKWFAIRIKGDTPTTGQRYEMLTFPVPNSSIDATPTLNFRYVYIPNVISATDKYPAGGAQYGETIIASVLACAEERLDDNPGGPFAQKFQSMLTQAMRADDELKGKQVPGT